MIKYLKNLALKIRLLWPFDSAAHLKVTQLTEKFDIVERVPVYTRTKF